VDRGVEARVDNERSLVHRKGTATRVSAFPVSIDYAAHNAYSSDAAVLTRMEAWREKLRIGDARIGVGIDRADYTKGIPERLRAIDRFFETCPEHRGRMVFVQVAVPSRSSISEYRRLDRELSALAEAINRRWRSGTWEPVRLIAEHLPQGELIALHRLSDFCLVTSLHDGMNLVAKEYVASRSDEDGVLILSTFTGAARELTNALLVNPYSPDQVATAVRNALNMPRTERAGRMRALRRTVEANDVYHWAKSILQCVADTTLPPWQQAAQGATASAGFTA
jgi:trehalose-6-phosphate synthase